MYSVGKQYSKDDKSDPSGFLRRARLHQSLFRANQLNLPCDKYGNYLTKEDAEAGYNFYPEFSIFEAVKNYRSYSENLYSNLLRSEHIPFNIFVPLANNAEYCRSFIQDLLQIKLFSVDAIKIEYAPKPKNKYLDDATSFDVYIEYTDQQKNRGAIGIEIKYTEREYKLRSGSKEEKSINDIHSPYFTVSEKSGIYKPGSYEKLKSDKFRQVWRNQLLGESLLLRNQEFSYFTSMTVFPSGNTHFVQIAEQYDELLVKNENKFIPVTYETFFDLLKKHSPDTKYNNWIEYLAARYIVNDE